MVASLANAGDDFGKLRSQVMNRCRNAVRRRHLERAFEKRDWPTIFAHILSQRGKAHVDDLELVSRLPWVVHDGHSVCRALLRAWPAICKKLEGEMALEADLAASIGTSDYPLTGEEVSMLMGDDNVWRAAAVALGLANRGRAIDEAQMGILRKLSDSATGMALIFGELVREAILKQEALRLQCALASERPAAAQSAALPTGGL